MKKSWLLPSLVLPASLALIAICWHHNEPPYLDAAHERVGSYLSYSFGPMDCTSEKVQGKNWLLDCKDAKGINDFKYVVYPSVDESRGYYMVAVSKDAKRSAKVDLMAFLEIQIKPSAV